MNEISIRTTKPNELINITHIVQQFVTTSMVEEGILFLHVPHTTAAITINENADPDVKTDILFGLKKISPSLSEFTHLEGNSDAHIKSSLIGVDQSIIIHNNRLQLGMWQGIYFCEFDGPRTRKLYLKILK